MGNATRLGPYSDDQAKRIAKHLGHSDRSRYFQEIVAAARLYVGRHQAMAEVGRGNHRERDIAELKRLMHASRAALPALLATRAMAAYVAVDDLSPNTRTLLDRYSRNLDAATDALRELTVVPREIVEILSALDANRPKAGGRPRLWERQDFLSTISGVYAAATNRRPTVATDRMTGDPTGPFFRYARCCCEPLPGLTHAELKDTALASALARVREDAE